MELLPILTCPLCSRVFCCLDHKLTHLKNIHSLIPRKCEKNTLHEKKRNRLKQFWSKELNNLNVLNVNEKTTKHDNNKLQMSTDSYALSMRKTYPYLENMSQSRKRSSDSTKPSSNETSENDTKDAMAASDQSGRRKKLVALRKQRGPTVNTANLSPRITRHLNTRVTRNVSPRIKSDVSPKIRKNVSPRIKSDASPKAKTNASPKPKRNDGFLSPNDIISPPERDKNCLAVFATSTPVNDQGVKDLPSKSTDVGPQGSKDENVDMANDMLCADKVISPVDRDPTIPPYDFSMGTPVTETKPSILTTNYGRDLQKYIFGFNRGRSPIKRKLSFYSYENENNEELKEILAPIKGRTPLKRSQVNKDGSSASDDPPEDSSPANSGIISAVANMIGNAFGFR